MTRLLLCACLGFKGTSKWLVGAAGEASENILNSSMILGNDLNLKLSPKPTDKHDLDKV